MSREGANFPPAGDIPDSDGSGCSVPSARGQELAVRRKGHRHDVRRMRERSLFALRGDVPETNGFAGLLSDGQSFAIRRERHRTDPVPQKLDVSPRGDVPDTD